MGILDSSDVPSYLVAADSHTIGNNQYSTLESIGYGTAAVAGSAVAQTLNILPELGNWAGNKLGLGSDLPTVNTKAMLQSFDDDLGKYYEQNQAGIDALGFAVSSFVPGAAGIKVFNGGAKMLATAAESGTFGTNIGKAFGLLAPSEPKILSKAIQSALQPNAGFPVWNADTIKAIALGAGTEAMRGVAFETAVAATMSQNPIMQQQDIADIGTNILHGAALFGAVGGVTKAAGTYFKIKGAGRALDLESAPFSHVAIGTESMSPADKILTMMHDAHTTPVVDAAKYTGEDAWKADKFASLREEKFRYIDTAMREQVGKLAGGDQVLADSLFGKFKALPFEEVEAKLYGTTETGRLSSRLKIEQEMSAAGKEFDLDSILANPISVQYTKIAGEGIGKTTAVKPELVHIADSIKAGTDYTTAVKSYNQSLKTTWDPLATTALESEARYVTALEYKFVPEVVTKIRSNDIPYLQSAYLQGAFDKITAVSAEGEFKFASQQQLFDYLVEQKNAIGSKLLAGDNSFAEVSRITDVESKIGAGATKGNAAESLIVTRSADQWAQPQWIKQAIDTTPVKDLDNNVVTGMVALKQKQRLYEDSADRVFASIIGEDSDKFYRLSDSDILRANRTGPGGGFLSSMNENFGSLGMHVQNLGAQSLRVIEKFRNQVKDTFSPIGYALGNNQAAAIEWSTINANLRSLPEAYGYDSARGVMRPLSLIQYERAIAEGKNVQMPILKADVPLEIPLQHAETKAIMEFHIAQNGKNVDALGKIRTNQGVPYTRNPEAFYPIPVNPRDFPFFGFVLDDSVSAYGRSTMIHASSEAELEQMITKVKSNDPTLRVLTKGDAEKWYKSVGQYEYERTLTDTKYDASIQRKGTSAPYLVATDPEKILADTLNWHLERQSNIVREAVLHQNEHQVATLQALGEKYSNVASSHYTKIDSLSYLDAQGKNPYSDYVKTMLGLSTSKEYPYWSSFNNMLDRKVSQVVASAKAAVQAARTGDELEKVNQMLHDAGYQGAAYDSMTAAFANHTAPKGVLSSFIAKANSILSGTMLGWDPINALTNLIGSNVLRGTELTSLVRQISEGNEEGAGALAKLGKLKVPDTDELVLSPAKLIGNALADLHSPAGAALRAELKSRNIISTQIDQANWVLEQLALTGKESGAQLDGKIKAITDAFNKGYTITGNALAEETNRFVSAHVAKQITDLAVAGGHLGEREAWAYVNTFVNRVEGNYIASQRPGVFQGPLGQAIGLFQTYQFNLLQQLLRHVGEGSGKDVAMMMGLQSSIFGLKGLPAFDAINTHIIGNASGNTTHRDIYDSVFGTVGKEAGDWLMYGMGSNALGLISQDLKLNLYTRGDINPRQLTVLPVNPANVPVVQAAGKMFSSLFETATKIGQGGDVYGSVLQGIEHAGVNRPLAGLAQALEAAGNPLGMSYSTSSRGDVQASNDFISFANLIRVAGAKPLDEAIGIDKAFNNSVYAAQDNKLRQTLGETIKTTVIAGKEPSQQQIEQFAAEYTKFGGQQQHFAQFMMQQYKAANTSQVNALARKVGSPFSTSMQTVMGGYEMRDFAGASAGNVSQPMVNPSQQ